MRNRLPKAWFEEQERTWDRMKMRRREWLALKLTFLAIVLILGLATVMVIITGLLTQSH